MIRAVAVGTKYHPDPCENSIETNGPFLAMFAQKKKSVFKASLLCASDETRG